MSRTLTKVTVDAHWKAKVARLLRLDREGKLSYKSADEVLAKLKGMLKKVNPQKLKSPA
jgi:hypothetical protein